MKYIDAKKLIEKFEKMIDNIPASVDSGAGYVIDEVYKIIDSLQQEQPEVDLEKEIQEHLKECLDVKFPTTDIELIKKDVAYTARKFYELGLNTRRNE